MENAREGDPRKEYAHWKSIKQTVDKEEGDYSKLTQSLLYAENCPHEALRVFLKPLHSGFPGHPAQASRCSDARCPLGRPWWPQIPGDFWEIARNPPCPTAPSPQHPEPAQRPQRPQAAESLPLFLRRC